MIEEAEVAGRTAMFLGIDGLDRCWIVEHGEALAGIESKVAAAACGCERRSVCVHHAEYQY